MELAIIIISAVTVLSFVSYAILILNFTRGWYRGLSENRSVGSEYKPDVSVVIPARNEQDKIAGLLDDLLVQDYPSSSLEIIVVDDHSSDRTADMVNTYIKRHPRMNLKLISPGERNGTGSKKRALTTGIGSATGELILTTDADCRVGLGWVTAMVTFFEDPGKMMITGPVSYFSSHGMFNRFQTLEFLGMMASGAGAVKAGMPFICNGANLAYRKEVFQELDGFEGNEKFLSGDDVFLLHKLKKAKGSLAIGFAHDPRALVTTSPAPGVSAFFRQRTRWASKSGGYRDRIALLTALSVFLTSLILVVIFILGFFNPLFFLLFGCLVFFKSIVDLPLMMGVTIFTGSRKLMPGYPIFQVIYPFYVVIAGVMSFRKRRRW